MCIYGLSLNAHRVQYNAQIIAVNRLRYSLDKINIKKQNDK